MQDFTSLMNSRSAGVVASSLRESKTSETSLYRKTSPEVFRFGEEYVSRSIQEYTAPSG